MLNTENKGRKLFLHSCCAPCSSYVIEYLRSFFRITVFYFNPNITEEAEYRKRAAEQKRLIGEMNASLAEKSVSAVGANKGTEDEAGACGRAEENGTGRGIGKVRPTETGGYPIEVVEGDYCRELFFERVKGLEKCREGGERCFVCYELRLAETARRAKAAGADYFTTTLTISPLKNAAKINEIGERLSGQYGVAFLPSDFKKKDGYKRSIELSREYDLYRQDYCGCVFSRQERADARQEISRRPIHDEVCHYVQSGGL